MTNIIHFKREKQRLEFMNKTTNEEQIQNTTLNENPEITGFWFKTGIDSPSSNLVNSVTTQTIKMI